MHRWFAPVYDAFRDRWGRWIHEAERELDRLFAERIGGSTRILELAPGAGVSFERLQRRAPGFSSYLGIDASAEMLEHARRKAGDDSRIELRRGRPRSAWLRLTLEWIFRVGSARPLDPEGLPSIPWFERLAIHAGGIATLAVFRRPET